MGLKHFPGYRSLLGPEQLRLDGNRRVSSPHEYMAWHTDVVTSRGGQPWNSPEAVTAYVNHGRWVADCAWCATGMLTRPDWAVAFCGECGARYTPGLVRYPADYRRIEEVLIQRVRRDQQNWDSRQTVAELAKENGLPEVMTP